MSWEAPPATQVTVLRSRERLGPEGAPVDLAAPPAGAVVVGSALGGGSAFDASPGSAAVLTAVVTTEGASVLCAAAGRAGSTGAHLIRPPDPPA